MRNVPTHSSEKELTNEEICRWTRLQIRHAVPDHGHDLVAVEASLDLLDGLALAAGLGSDLVRVESGVAA